jgi:hypothetical protein
MDLHRSNARRVNGFEPEPGSPDSRDHDDDHDDDHEAPETPTDEPRPPRIQDPPPQPDQQGPYTVCPQWWL